MNSAEYIQYIQEKWMVKKDTILAAITAVENGIEYTRECLAQHEAEIGRTTMKNKSWAETMEEHMEQMQNALIMLKSECP